MPGRVWQINPHGGGRSIPESVRETTRASIVEHAAQHFGDRAIEVRFRAQFCYVDAYLELAADGDDRGAGGTAPDGVRSEAMQLCRLRYFGPDRWSLAIYSYAHERYDPSVFGDGEWFGPAAAGFDLAGNLYLT